MASNQPIVSEAAVLDRDPDVDEQGRVVRVAGLVNVAVDPTLPLLQRRFDITDPVIYIGYAARGELESAPVWTIKRIEFIAGNPVTLQWATPVAWTDRLVAVYS